MRFRICRFQLDNGEFETVATSLPRSFRLEDIKALYHLRWGLEVGFRDLKYTLGLVNLHGKSDEFAEQEIYAGLTAFNFASRVCQEVVVRQPKDGVYAYKVNFKMAVALCKEFIRTPKVDADKLLQDIARHTVPIQPGRQDNRNLRVKGFPGFVYRVAAWKKEGAGVELPPSFAALFFEKAGFIAQITGFFKKMRRDNLTAWKSIFKICDSLKFQHVW